MSAMRADERRFFLYTWYQRFHELRDRHLRSQIHKVRDGLASVYIATFLAECGYRFGGVLLNVPRRILSKMSELDLTVSPLQAGPDDLIWIPTRLPINEIPRAARSGRKERLRIIDRSETPFEDQ